MSWRTLGDMVGDGPPAVRPRPQMTGPYSLYPILHNPAPYTGNSHFTTRRHYTLTRLKQREFYGGSWHDLGWGAWTAGDPYAFMLSCFASDSSTSKNEITMQVAAFGSVWKVDYQIESNDGTPTYTYDSVTVHPGGTYTIGLTISTGIEKSVTDAMISVPG